MNETLGTEFPKEIERVRKLLGHYEELPVGAKWFVMSWMPALLKQAEAAWAEQDTVAMVTLYPKLKECK